MDYTTPITERLRQRHTGLRKTADPSLLVESLLDLSVLIVLVSFALGSHKRNLQWLIQLLRWWRSTRARSSKSNKKCFSSRACGLCGGVRIFFDMYSGYLPCSSKLHQAKLGQQPRRPCPCFASCRLLRILRKCYLRVDAYIPG